MSVLSNPQIMSENNKMYVPRWLKRSWIFFCGIFFGHFLSLKPVLQRYMLLRGLYYSSDALSPFLVCDQLKIMHTKSCTGNIYLHIKTPGDQAPVASENTSVK